MHRRLLCGALAAGFVLVTSAVARADDACWQLLYAALERDAAAPHAAYISYSELVNIQDDGHRYERVNANITYRDDGIASVDDERFARPFMSAVLEPGPPVLGPYGSRRQNWLEAASAEYTFPLIAAVHNQTHRACVDMGDETVNGLRVAHLVLSDAPANQPTLKALWIDRRSKVIARIVLADYFAMYTGAANLKSALTDFSIDMQNVDGYQVLQRVTWSYTYRVYDQTSRLQAEYDFDNYRFAMTPPADSLFSSGIE